ncbi:DNRLRE domain-containing protein [Paenibacillus sp. JX-17]|uniref:DNRLRE domain-containing protein n=1 Tax=Paenibacillus lacisoli TaxID=3064525 RepID=A0ABT9CJV3_9BACL|nr:DNRLRE domain-containing protein [Paenibacillus sp. JX-17]MDO7908904.1 DNRLRE domain-containing protein [Paenibacillus sp. JX-17]
MHANHKWIVSTLLLSAMGASVLPFAAPASAASVTKLKSDASRLDAPSVSEKAADQNDPQMVEEMPEMRTLYSKQYLMDDGSYETMISLMPLHYVDPKGSYKDIQLRLEPVQQVTDGAGLSTSNMDRLPISAAESSNSIENVEQDRKKQQDSKEQQESSSSQQEQPQDSSQQNPEITPVPEPENDQSDKQTEEETDANKNESPAADPSGPTVTDATYTSSTVPYVPVLHTQFDQGYALTSGDSLHILPLGTQSATADTSRIADGVLSYSDAWPSTDVQLRLTERGIDQTLLLKSASSPSAFSYRIEGKLQEDGTAGALSVQPVWAEDAAGVKHEVQQTIRQHNGAAYLDMSLNSDQLQYPVTLHAATGLNNTGLSQEGTVTSALPAAGRSVQGGLLVGVQGETTFQSYLQFDLSMIPAKSEILGARLQLTASGSHGLNGVLQVLGNKEPWQAGQLRWENKPASYEADQGQLDLQGNDSPSIRLDESLITDWVSRKKPNYGMQLVYKSANNELLTLSSSENVSEAARPRLYISYSTDGMQLRSLAQASIRFSYDYDEQSRLQTIQFPTGELIRFTYDKAGNVVKREYIGN